jgi:hypothetical protein
LLRLRQHVSIRRSDHPILIEEPLVHQRRGEPSQAQLVRIAPRPRITKQDAEGNRRRSDEARRPRVRRRSPGVAAAERKRQRVGGRRSSSPVQPPISIGASGPACGREPRWCRRTMWRMNGGATVDSVSAGARPALGGATSGSENSPRYGRLPPRQERCQRQRDRARVAGRYASDWARSRVRVLHRTLMDLARICTAPSHRGGTLERVLKRPDWRRRCHSSESARP